MKIEIKDARKKIGELLYIAKMGEEVILTRRGIPEGKIIALNNKDSGKKGLPNLTELYESLKMTGKSLSKIVIQEREQRN